MLSLAAIIVLLFVNTPDYAALLLAFFAASVIPDIDSKNSKVRKTASVLIPAAVAFLVVLGADTETRIISGLIAFSAAHIILQSLPISHRGRKSLHRIPVMVMLSVFIGSAVWLVFGSPELWKTVTASLLGCMSHIAADKLLNRE